MNEPAKWVTKPSTDAQCFFRKSIPETVKQLQEVYNKCKLGDSKHVKETEVCVKNVFQKDKNEDFNLQFLLTTDRKIVSAYPIKSTITTKCKRFLDYNAQKDCPK